MPTNYYKKYKKYKNKYLGGTVITKENILPLGCFGEYGNETINHSLSTGLVMTKSPSRQVWA